MHWHTHHHLKSLDSMRNGLFLAFEGAPTMYKGKVKCSRKIILNLFGTEYTIKKLWSLFYEIMCIKKQNRYKSHQFRDLGILLKMEKIIPRISTYELS